MSFNYVFMLACLCAGLLFDPNGFLRMALSASVLHEIGHILAFIICKHKFPPISASVGGFTLGNTTGLSQKQEIFVLICGPAVNLGVAFAIFQIINIKASYFLYFFMAVNLLLGVYNLLPFGVLDGAKIIKGLIPSCKEHILYKVQIIILLVFSLLCLFVAFFGKINSFMFISLLVAPIYLWICEFKK